jgi:hypothetical protein
MLNVKINQKSYKIRGIKSHKGELLPDWSEITINKAEELKCYIDTECPKVLLDYYEALTKEGEPTIELDGKDRIKTLPTFYGGVLSILSNIPQEVVNKILWEQRTTIYKQYLEYFVIYSLYTDNTLKPYKDDHFTHNGTNYYLPKAEEALGTMIEAYDTTIVEFQQASDVQLAMQDVIGGNISGLKTMIAIYCRPKGEKYNEKKAIERANQFGELPMDLALGVFFCILESVNQFITDTLLSLGAQEALNMAELSKSPDWKVLAGLLQSVR